MLNVGQEVRVFDVNGKREGMPEDGWPGEVVKVGRTRVIIRCPDGEKTFMLDTGRAVGRYGSRAWFLTLGQAAEQRRRDSALAILRECGVETHRTALSTGQLMAMAEIARDGIR